MEGLSRLAFALALTVILSLTLLLGLLAYLFCSLLCRGKQRHFREESPLPEPIDGPLSFPFYAHGVIKAPTKFLLSSPILKEVMATPPPSVYDFDLHISNPIYDGGVGRGNGDLGCTSTDTGTDTNTTPAEDIRYGYVSDTSSAAPKDDSTDPFVTPKASPSSGLEVEDEGNNYSPPLKLMKKLPCQSIGTGRWKQTGHASSSNSLLFMVINTT